MISSGTGGFRPPSYQNATNPGRLGSVLGPNSHFTIICFGKVSVPRSTTLIGSAESGASAPIDHQTLSHVWQPMSPIAPQPKSIQPRHLNGT